jgi:hypothetical protein
MRRPTEAEQRQWDEDGYVVIENAVSGDALAKLQEAHTYWGGQCKGEWLAEVALGKALPTCYDVPDAMLKDPIFMDLVDYPGYFGYVQKFAGDDPLAHAPQVRTVPPWPISYCGWHPDVGKGPPRRIKVQIYVSDVDEAGAFGFVPGSHRTDRNPFYRYHDPKSMPGHRVFSGKAGTAIMFNIAGLHTAMPNRSEPPRQSAIIMYDRDEGQRTVSDDFANIDHLCTTPARRRLFQLEK